jgi:hypothetical protein
MPSTRTKLVNQIDSFSALEQRLYVASAMDLWYTELIPTLAVPKAFALLRFGFLQESPFYKPLMKALLTYHVIHINRRGTPYRTLSETKRQAALTALSEALEPFPQTYAEWLILIPDTDRWKPIVQERYELQFIFRRDPEGSIDLQAFAMDSESVHRSSVQEMIAKNLDIIFTYPLAKEQDTFNELLSTLPHPLSKLRDIIYVLASDIDTLYVPLLDCTVKYSDVLDHVWAFIKGSEHKEELFQRLLEELADGHLTCPNGRLARLLNVLQGYDLMLPSVENRGVLLQNRMAAIAQMPFEEREGEARKAFQEFNVSKDEQGAWLEPLLA